VSEIVEGKVKVMVVKADIYSRVVGYYRPVNDWNNGKREEFKDRKYWKIREDENG